MKKKLSLLTGVIVLAVCSFFAMTAYAQELDISSSDFSAVLNTTSYTYDTKAKEPSVTVKYTDENGKTLTLKKDTDYTVTYKNNNNAGTATCPECGTEYDIAAYGGTGAPVKGVSKYPLRRYAVSSKSSSRQEWIVIN